MSSGVGIVSLGRFFRFLHVFCLALCADLKYGPRDLEFFLHWGLGGVGSHWVGFSVLSRGDFCLKGRVFRSRDLLIQGRDMQTWLWGGCSRKRKVKVVLV